MNLQGGLIRINKNKIFAIQNDKNNFLVTITEKNQDGKRSRRVYKNWDAVPENDKQEYFAARALKNIENAKATIFNTSNQNTKK